MRPNQTNDFSQRASKKQVIPEITAVLFRALDVESLGCQLPNPTQAASPIANGNFPNLCFLSRSSLGDRRAIAKETSSTPLLGGPQRLCLADGVPLRVMRQHTPKAHPFGVALSRGVLWHVARSDAIHPRRTFYTVSHVPAAEDISRRWAMLRVAMASGPSVKSKTSTDIASS